jgi:hypothetical protein
LLERAKLFHLGPGGGATAARYPQYGRLLVNPCPRKDSAARTRKTKKRILAPTQEKLATPPKPRKAAIKAMTRNRIATRSMVRFSFKKVGLLWRSISTAGNHHLGMDREQLSNVVDRTQGVFTT